MGNTNMISLTSILQLKTFLKSNVQKNRRHMLKHAHLDFWNQTHPFDSMQYGIEENVGFIWTVALPEESLGEIISKDQSRIVKSQPLTNSLEEFSNGQNPIEINDGRYLNAKFSEKYRAEKSRWFGHVDHIGLGTDIFCKEDMIKQTLDTMQHFGIGMQIRGYAELLQEFAKAKALAEGKMVHSHMIKTGSYLDTFVSNHLVHMYVKCGSLGDARLMFEKMPKRNMVTWTAMIAGYAQNGCGSMAIKLFCQMLEAGARANQFTFASVLTACASVADLGYGRQVHVHMIMSGFDLNVFVGNALITMYAKCGSMEAAKKTFDEIPEPNLISQNAIIAGYVQHGFDLDALAVFSQVQQLGIGADEFTFASVLAACANLVAVEQGRVIHAHIVKSIFKSSVFVGSSLVDVYAKCGYIADAYKVFDKMPEKDTVLWNSMIAGYVHNKQGEKAIKQLHQMQREGIRPDRFSLTSILGACICIEYLNYGKQVHAYTIRTRLNSNLSLNNALINIYVSCQCIDNAKLVFDKMAEHNIVSWTAIIVGYVHEKHEEEALKIFCKMQQAGMKPNQFTFATIFSACGNLAALENGKQVLAQAIKIGFGTNVCVRNSIIAMYAQCGNLEESKKVFNDTPERDVVTWNAIISGCAQHGHGNEALQLFENMQDLGVNPDPRTFVCVLSACRHAGLLKDARHIFDSMIRDYRIIPRLEHYACMVDLLGRVGQLDQAMDFIKQMPIEPNASMWQTLIGACKVHGNVELGKHAAEHILELEPQAAETYILLSNIYAAARRWDDVAYVRNLMNERGVLKDPGCSWIEVQNRVHIFTVGD